MQLDPQKPRPALRQATAVVREGGVVCYPADTIYGLGCDPFNRRALARLMRLKGRDPGRGLLCLVSAGPKRGVFTERPPAVFRTLADRFWPGPVTLIVPAASGLPIELTGERATIGLRCPDSPWLQQWLQALETGLVSTSANRSGEPPLADLESIRHAFADRIDLYLETTGFTPAPPSTVVDLTSTPPRIVRRGDGADEVEAFLTE